MTPPRGLLVTLAFGLLLALPGCVPIPVLAFGDVEGSRQNITDLLPDAIVVGKTTRAEVLLALGDPDQKSQGDLRFLYVRESEEGGIAFLMGGPNAGGVVGTPRTLRLLVIGFDAAGVVLEAKARKVTRRDWGQLSREASLW